MYRIPPQTKNDPAARWALPDHVFFACGACHILTYAFLQRYQASNFSALWIKPAKGFGGNHIIAVRDDTAFDYHGYTGRNALLAHIHTKANRWWPGWDCERVPLPTDVLVSQARSKTYDGLWLREPQQFLHDALPRAERFLDHYPPPAEPH